MKMIRGLLIVLLCIACTAAAARELDYTTAITSMLKPLPNKGWPRDMPSCSLR